MSGTPIPGTHFIELKFSTNVRFVESITIDWETAYANDYVLEVVPSGDTDAGESDNWSTLFDAESKSDSISISKSKQHIVHDISIKQEFPNGIAKLRLFIRRGATEWGSSVWRFKAIGN